MTDLAKARHPKGLAYLFLTEMWERFGFYLIIGIFFLYMTDTAEGGLGFTNANAADIFGTYIALVYFTPFLGGLLADRILGYRLAITIGGLLMAAGYMVLAIPGEASLWPAMILVIFGNGFFKPNISTLVGNLYAEDKLKHLKDSGYNIFYLGINIGAFLCNFVAAYLRNEYGWGHAFMAAGIGMLIGLVFFWVGTKHIRYADVKKPKQREDLPMGRIISYVMLPALVFGVLGWLIPGNIFGSDSTDAFVLGCIPVVFFYTSLWVRASKEDKGPIGALLAIFGVVIVFWAIFHQNGTALTIWADSYTHRELSDNSVPFWRTFGGVQEVDNQLFETTITDSHGREVLGSDGKPATEMLPHAYLRNLPQEQWPPDGESLKLISTELFQSINPGFIIILTFPVVWFFAFLRKRNREPSTPAKLGYGLLITAVSTLVMVWAVVATHNGEIKGSILWLFGTYGVITLGELFLSPMGLSLVSKLAPARLGALMMGGWFLSTSIGNKLSGVIGGLWDSIPNKVEFFMINFAGAFVAGIAIMLMVKWLRSVVIAKTGSK